MTPGDRSPKGSTRPTRTDRGNISLLSLGLTVLALMLVLVVASATAVHAERMRLLHLSDALAIDAADSLDLAAFYAGTVAPPTDNAAIDLAEQRMRASVALHLQQNPEGIDTSAIRVVDVSTTDGATATVTIQTVVKPIFLVDALLPWWGGVTITVTSSARAY